MTNGEKMFIAQQLKQGLGYSEIARKLNMSVNTGQAIRRNGLRKPLPKACVQARRAVWR